MEVWNIYDVHRNEAGRKGSAFKALENRLR